ncbi:hypothetical protein BYT27DRAFT_6938563 [Phlegmacium glaucopus]|nr:hypothetical protein BYT27DRAFT_6938563 [Phlegmacium glaucopus]
MVIEAYLGHHWPATRIHTRPFAQTHLKLCLGTISARALFINPPFTLHSLFSLAPRGPTQYPGHSSPERSTARLLQCACAGLVFLPQGCGQNPKLKPMSTMASLVEEDVIRWDENCSYVKLMSKGGDTPLKWSKIESHIYDTRRCRIIAGLEKFRTSPTARILQTTESGGGYTHWKASKN